MGPRRVGAQNFACLCPLPATNFFLSSSIGSLFVEFWWCLKRHGPEMCTFGVLWVIVCEPRRPGPGGPPGFHTTSHRAQTCILEGSQPSKNTTEIQREDTQERQNLGRERKKQRNFGLSGGGGVRGKVSCGGGSAQGGPVEDCLMNVCSRCPCKCFHDK